MPSFFWVQTWSPSPSFLLFGNLYRFWHCTHRETRCFAEEIRSFIGVRLLLLWIDSQWPISCWEKIALLISSYLSNNEQLLVRVESIDCTICERICIITTSFSYCIEYTQFHFTELVFVCVIPLIFVLSMLCASNNTDMSDSSILLHFSSYSVRLIFALRMQISIIILWMHLVIYHGLYPICKSIVYIHYKHVLSRIGQ